MSADEMLYGIDELIRQFSAPTREITPASKFREDLDMDSLTTIELFTAAERRFGVVIPDEEVGSINTVGELRDFVARATAS
uniref:Acyl carrier protein n=1 Tax=Streptomyces sp. CNB091 TaxID=1169156 RepID=A0A2P2CLB1_9ACTN|nr:TPA_exp: acyl carrier protein [Streptomyces sp. CNB091]